MYTPSNTEEAIIYLLENFSAEEIFDMLEMPLEDAINILIEGGHVKLPPFLDK